MAETLSPTGKLDLSAVTKLHADLVAHANQDVIVDMKDVTQLGALCMQVFMAAATAAETGGHRFILENLPDPVTENIKSMGFDAQNLTGAVHGA